jgi:hypothetical protein
MFCVAAAELNEYFVGQPNCTAFAFIHHSGETIERYFAIADRGGPLLC